MNSTVTEDKILLKELVDKVSILGDQKDFTRQVQLFTEHAVSETLADGRVILKLEGRAVMAEAFSEFLKEVDIVYHFNGQSLFTVEGDQATGSCYCLITLTSCESGRKIMTTLRAVYNDHYVRLDNQWLIEKRVGNFLLQDKREVG